MAATTRRLEGRRGWAAVATLSLALGLAVVDALPGRDASAAPLVGTAAAQPLLVASEVPDRPVPRPELTRAAVLPATPPAAAVAVVPAAAPPAPAPAAPGLCSGEGWQQRRGEAALASLRSGAERTGFRVEFAPARKGYMGLTHLQQRRIEVFVRSCEAQTDALLRHVVAHELGHAYDTTHMTTATRAAWQAARGIGGPWYGCSGCTDFATPAGDFAEVYAQWLRGTSSNKSQLAGAPGPAELQALAQRFFGA